eukprot:m.397197 g.397197  ORF g.397197 m.397197 type:complete len:663 (+) comp21126_c0_seq1:351-2339(+)
MAENVQSTTIMQSSAPASSGAGTSMNTRVIGFLERQKMYQKLQEKRMNCSDSRSPARGTKTSNSFESGRAPSARLTRQRTRSASDVSNMNTNKCSIDGRNRRSSLSSSKPGNRFDRSYSLNGLRGLEGGHVRGTKVLGHPPSRSVDMPIVLGSSAARTSGSGSISRRGASFRGPDQHTSTAAASPWVLSATSTGSTAGRPVSRDTVSAVGTAGPAPNTSATALAASSTVRGRVSLSRTATHPLASPPHPTPPRAESAQSSAEVTTPAALSPPVAESSTGTSSVPSSSSAGSPSTAANAGSTVFHSRVSSRARPQGHHVKSWKDGQTPASGMQPQPPSAPPRTRQNGRRASYSNTTIHTPSAPGLPSGSRPRSASFDHQDTRSRPLAGDDSGASTLSRANRIVHRTQEIADKATALTDRVNATLATMPGSATRGQPGGNGREAEAVPPTSSPLVRPLVSIATTGRPVAGTVPHVSTPVRPRPATGGDTTHTGARGQALPDTRGLAAPSDAANRTAARVSTSTAPQDPTSPGATTSSAAPTPTPPPSSAATGAAHSGSSTSDVVDVGDTRSKKPLKRCLSARGRLDRKSLGTRVACSAGTVKRRVSWSSIPSDVEFTHSAAEYDRTSWEERWPEQSYTPSPATEESSDDSEDSESEDESSSDEE